jgi:hypothetical protein
MICGATQEKNPCPAVPTSPASTAGNSLSSASRSSIQSTLHLLNDFAEDVLILNGGSWTLPLDSSEDIARLCRCIRLAHEPFMAKTVSSDAILTWRLFQAADHYYNGYVTFSDIDKLLVSFHPSLGQIERASSDSDSGHMPMVYWDVLSWWQRRAFGDTERRTIEHHVLRRVVVASDGLWAGLNLGALLRIWKTVCRSVGYLFRFHAQRYLHSTFLALRSLPAELEAVLILISEAINRISKKAGNAWVRFIDLDADDDGKLSELELATLLDDQRLKCSPIATIPISRSTSGSSSMLIDPDIDDKSVFTFIQVLDAMLEIREVSLSLSSKTIRLLPGQQPELSTFSDKWNDFWRTLKPQKQNGKHLRPLARCFGDPEKTARTMSVYVKTYLDIEQWRGQKCTEEGTLSSSSVI